MRVISGKNKIQAVDLFIKNRECFDYIYMYPPRQSYYEIDNNNFSDLIEKSIINDVSDIYIHFPFCKQICSFCNLYVTNGNNNDKITGRYLSALLKEISKYSKILQSASLETLYFGGGTPSLLNIELFEKLFSYINNKLDINTDRIKEISIEVSPETVTFEKMLQLKSLGVNRINLGFQSTNNEQLFSINRSYNNNTLYNSYYISRESGIENICIDLIYGLENQTLDSWINDLKSVVALNPETICIYPLTLRPRAPYFSQGFKVLNSIDRYKKYNIAVNILLKNNYHLESHVRFTKLKSSGYLQKENHWNSNNILGFGAGSRSYLHNIDFTNGYSLTKRNYVLNKYINGVCREKNIGYEMNDNERMRKEFILGLNGIGYDNKNMDIFSNEIDYLINRKFIFTKDSNIYYTNKGHKYRDIIVQLFFIEKVIYNITNFEY
jgi:oxygen-independent coproporphyrinogen-3 oxidase